MTVPVVGNGDLLFGHEIQERLSTSGCAAVMTARGALIKPWIFREVTEGYWDITRRGARGDSTGATSNSPSSTGARARSSRSGRPSLDDHARERMREFLRWHVGFWVRYAPPPRGRHVANDAAAGVRVRAAVAARGAAGAQRRRRDRLHHRQLIDGGDLADPPEPSTTEEAPVVVEAG